MELKRYLRVVASTGDDDDDYSMVEISNNRAREAADRIEKLEAALIAIKAMHHDGGIDDLQERDDRTYCMVCDALEGKDE